ncbi:PAS domain S-box protein [Lyngbya confervoides]|uniref:histidine kinase n=1 Tax=Lyngbya confervoides BDU141951 TaxID=1574623 RepID=A0ABD4T4Q5_9CYAN|nr:PAS domain S-box protein [Lyngbya confervoides]MCM1983781.1 PAS domain S-box protein [Lyngbya confervoides BDU141951]
MFAEVLPTRRWTEISQNFCPGGTLTDFLASLSHGVSIVLGLVTLGVIVLYVWDRHRFQMRWQQAQTDFQQEKTKLQQKIHDLLQTEPAPPHSALPFSPALQTAKVAMWQWEKATHQFTWTDERFRLLGYDPQTSNPTYEQWRQAVHPEDRACLDTLLNCENPEGAEIEYRMMRPDGSVRWVRERSFPMVNDLGQVYQVVGVAEDITPYKQSEADLRQTCDFLKTILDHLPIAVFVKDGRADHFGKMLLWNLKSEQLFGLTADQAIGKTDYDHFPKDQADFFFQKDRSAFDRGQPEDIPEESIDSYSLGRRLLHTVKIPFYNDHQQPEFLLCFSEDITERKQAEAALRESEARWQFALEGSGDGVWDWNAQTNQVFFSRQWKAMLGYADHEVGIGLEEWDSRIHPEDRDRCYADLQQHFRGETSVYRNEHRVCCKDGSYKWILDRGKVIEWTAEGQPLRVIGTHTDITERKQAEAALRESEAWARLAIQVGQLGGWRLHLDTNRVEMDERLREIWDEPEDVAMTPLTQVMERVHPEDRSRVASAVNAAIAPQSQGHYESEYRLVWKDGTERWVSAKGQAQFEGEGESRRAVGFFGTVLDITDRKRLETALQESLDHLQQLNDNVPAIVYRYVLHPDGSDALTYLSENVQEIFELPLEVCLQQMSAVWERIHPEDIPRLRTTILDSAQSLQPWQEQYRFTVPSGRQKWLEAKSSPKRQPNGAVVWDGVIVDISDRKRAEEALQASEHRYAQILNSVQDMVFCKDAHSKVLYANQATCTYYGMTLEQLQGIRDVSFNDDEHTQQYLEADQQVFLTGKPVETLDEPNRRADGTIRYFHTIKSPIFDTAGNVVELVGVSRDITERKQLTTALQENRDHLQQLNDNVPAIVYRYILHADGRDGFTYLSENAQKIYEMPLEVCLNQMSAVWARIHPEDIPRLQTTILASAQSLQPWQGQYRFTVPSGRQKWLEAKSSPKLQPNGAVVWDGVIVDISDRKRIEQELRMSIKALDSHFDTSLLAIIEWDRDRNIKRWSKEAEQIFGWSEAEIQSMDIPSWQFVYEEDADWVSNQMVLLRQGVIKRCRFENRNYRKDGTVITCEWHSSVIFDDGGNLESMLSFAQDISDRKQFEATLQQRLQREQSLNRVFQAIRQSLDLDVIFATATAETARLMPDLDCCVVQYCPTQGVWKHVAEFQSSPNSPRLMPLEIPDLDYPFASQIKRSEIVRVEALDNLENENTQNLACSLSGAWLHIPLQVEDKIWGSFALNTPQRPFTWTEAQVHLAQVVAGQLEIAIQQAQLYQRVEQEKQKLLHSQRALLQAQQIAELGSWELDAATQSMVWSDSLFQMFGFDPAAPEPDFAEVMMTYIHPEDRPRLEQVIKRAMTAGTSYEIDLRFFRADGSMGYMEARAEAVRDDTGQIVKVVGTSLDISDRKFAEQQLQNLVEATAATTGKDFFPALVNHISRALQVSYALVSQLVDDELQTLAFWANGSLQPNFCYHPAKTPCEYTLKQRVFYCSDSVQQRFPDDVDLVQMQAESYLGVTLKGAQGQVIGNLCVLDQQRLQNSEQAEVLLRVFAARAAAELEREQAQQALKQLNRTLEALVEERTAQLTHRTIQLEATNGELESFSYSVSHDLRAPLRHIHGFVSALRQQLDSHQALSDPKVVHYLQVIESSSHKMGQLIDGLLMLSRLGSKAMQSRPVVLRDLVDEAIALHQGYSETPPSVQFVIGALPIVEGDATLLQQVFSNLISNALKFSCHQPTPQVEIGTLADGTLFVRDNGVGFQMEYADKLFGAFQRLHAQADFEGTGIGLAICKRIIHRHGGRIWAESQLDQGTIFYFTLGESAIEVQELRGST